MIGGQTSAITYLSPDPAYTGTLKQANLRNSNDNVVYSPTADDVNLALQNSGSGGLPGSAPHRHESGRGWLERREQRRQPVQLDPCVGQPDQGYPIAGPTNLVLSQCYTSAAVANDVKDFLTKHYDAGNLLPGDHLLVALSRYARRDPQHLRDGRCQEPEHRQHDGLRQLRWPRLMGRGLQQL